VFSIFSPVNSSATLAFVVPSPTTMRRRCMARFISGRAATLLAITRFDSDGVRDTSAETGSAGSKSGIRVGETTLPTVY
jgi:hypothetical protein